MNRKTLNAFRALLVTLITATAITGISYLDDQIWNIIMAILGFLAYEIVGFLYSKHMIFGKEAGRESFVAVFIILLIIGVLIYNGILKVEQWILSWPLFVKIIVPSVMVVGIITIVILLIHNRRKQNVK